MRGKTTRVPRSVARVSTKEGDGRLGHWRGKYMGRQRVSLAAASRPTSWRWLGYAVVRAAARNGVSAFRNASGVSSWGRSPA